MPNENLEKYRRIIAGCKDRISLDPNDLDALFEASYAYRKLEDFNSARESLLAILAVEPSDHEALHALGLVLWNMNQLHESLHCLSEAVRLWPKEPLYFADLGDLLFALGQIQKAQIAFEKGLQIALPYEDIYERLINSIDLIRFHGNDHNLGR